MANGLVSLGYLRLQAQQRSDTENNPTVSTPEWNQYLSSSYKELYDLILAAYGNDYYAALAYSFALTGARLYNLPDGSSTYQVNGSPAAAFYKLLGVDLQYSGSPTGYVTLRNFELIDRNKMLTPNTSTSYSAYTNLRYRLLGNQLWFNTIPSVGQSVQLWYAPQPSNLIFAPSCALVSANATVTVSDAQGLSAGMSLYYPSAIASTTTIQSVNTSNNTIVLTAAPTATVPIAVIPFWRDDTTIDGIAGWEEYVIVDAAIKACIKCEFPTAELAGQKADMKKRIEQMAEGRDAGQAHHVSDALSINGFGGDYGDGFGGGGWGGF